MLGWFLTSKAVPWCRWLKTRPSCDMLFKTMDISLPRAGLWSVHSIHSFIGSTALSWTLAPPQFPNHRVGRTLWTSDQPVARPLPTHRTTQTHNKCTQTSMPWVAFEPTVPAFERAKTVHTLDRASTVMGSVKRSLYTFHISFLNVYADNRIMLVLTDNEHCIICLRFT
jgi:hypothetical protein